MIYGLVLFVSVILLLAWITGVSMSGSVRGWEWADPERLLGGTGRRVVAGGVGFGMAGLSASFGGWPVWAAAGAAAVGTVVAVWYAGRFGPGEEG